jgi:hypothetical protein
LDGASALARGCTEQRRTAAVSRHAHDGLPGSVVGFLITTAVITIRFSSRAGAVPHESGTLRRTARGTVVAVHAGMDTQLMFVGFGGVLVLTFMFQVFRSARGHMTHAAVSETWLAERKRMKDEHE